MYFLVSSNASTAHPKTRGFALSAPEKNIICW